MASSDAGETVSPTWTFCFFNCGAPDMGASDEAEHRKSALRIGIQREMAVMYQQPHLVPPMKLTVYDQMPTTPVPPPPSHLSKMMSQGRNLASRASERASLTMRKRSSRPIISNPMTAVERKNSMRRYRPLELSIYAPQNRLSDLPEFDSEAVNFADDGAIQLPPRALVKAKSQEFKRTPSQRTPNKSKSMIEPTLLHRRTDTASTIVSTSRPPSNYDALRSHPVSWVEGSLPGLPPQCHHHNPTQATTILSPMQEEFTPACTPACITIDGTVLEFPKVDPEPRPSSPEHEAAPAPQIVSTTVSKRITVAPFKLSRPPTSASAKPSSPSQFQDSPTLPTSHQGSPSLSSVYSSSSSSTKTSQRLSHWLNHHRGPSSSTSISTTRSFAEHRRKRGEFYQVRIPKSPPQMPKQTMSPTPSSRIPFQQTFKSSHQRQRTMSGSTIGSVSTVSTDIMSLEDAGPNDSMTTMSTAHVQDVRSTSKASTTRSFSKPTAVVREVREEVPDLPFVLHGVPAMEEYPIIKEIGGPLRSPGVGLAF